MTTSLIEQAPDLLSKIEQGALIRDIAKQYGVTRAAVSNALRKSDPQRYMQAREIGIESRLENALQDQMDAQDQVSIARSREVFRSNAWLAERTLPHIYGAKQEVTHKGIETVIVNRRAAVTIDQGAQGGGTLSQGGVAAREPDRYGITSVDSASHFTSVDSKSVDSESTDE